MGISQSSENHSSNDTSIIKEKHSKKTFNSFSKKASSSSDRTFFQDNIGSPRSQKTFQSVSKKELLSQKSVTTQQNLIIRCGNRIRLLLESISKNNVHHDLDVFELQELLSRPEFDLIPDSTRDHLLVSAVEYIGALSHKIKLQSKSQDQIILLYIKTLALVVMKISETDLIEDVDRKVKKDLRESLRKFESHFPSGLESSLFHYYTRCARFALDKIGERKEDNIVAQVHKLSIFIMSGRSIVEGVQEAVGLVSSFLGNPIGSVIYLDESIKKIEHVADKITGGFEKIQEMLGDLGDIHAWLVMHRMIKVMVEAYTYKRKSDPDARFENEETVILSVIKVVDILANVTDYETDDALGRLELLSEFLKQAPEELKDAVWEEIDPFDLDELAENNEAVYFKLSVIFADDIENKMASRYVKTMEDYEGHMMDRLDARIQELMSYEDKVLEEQNKRFEARYREDLQHYVPSKCKSSRQSEESKPFEEALNNFLQGDCSVLLVQGDAGVGKTSAARYFSNKIRRKFDYCDQFFPVYIFLGEPGLNPQTCVEDKLRECGANTRAIAELKKKYQFLIFLDAFDELNQQVNLFESNQLSAWKGVKVVVTCRSQYINAMDNPMRLFNATTINGEPNPASTLYLTPFDDDQMKDYIGHFLEAKFEAREAKGKEKKGGPTKKQSLRAIDLDEWDLERYLQRINKMPDLKEKLRTPMLLKIALAVLPSLEGREKIGRPDLYEAFTKLWVGREKGGLQEALGYRTESEFENDFLSYAMQLAYNMTFTGTVRASDEDGQLRPKLESKKEATWENFFTDNDKRTLAKRLGCPIKRMGKNQYGFIHKSFQDYYTALKLLRDMTQHLEIYLGTERKGKKISKIDPEKLLLNSVLAKDGRGEHRTYIISETVILEILGEMLVADERIKDFALTLIRATRQQPELETAAATVITALNYGRFNFRGQDLSGVCISRADLSANNFDHVSFKEAKLENVRLRESCLSRANFKKANMLGADFGEKMLIDVQSPVKSVAFSPSEKWLVSGSDDKMVRLWKVEDGSAGPVFHGHTDVVLSVAFSPSETWLASGSWDQTVRLWKVKNGSVGHVLQGHTSNVTSVVFSPSEKLLASGSWDQTVRLWKVENGSAGPVLHGHTSNVSSVAFSPFETWLASGSWDHTVRLWTVEDGSAGPVLKGHTSNVTSVAFSWSGKWLASGSWDRTVRLWTVEDGSAGPVLNGHTSWVNSVTFCTSTKWLASSSDDNTVRFWNVEDGSAGPVLQGHTSNVTSVMFSPSEKWLVSGSLDETVRLWKAGDSSAGPVLQGYTREANSVTFSPSEKWLASSWDGIVRMWRAEDGSAGPVFHGPGVAISSLTFSPSEKWLASGSLDFGLVYLFNMENGSYVPFSMGQSHKGSVRSVAFSPSERWLASGSDDHTVRLWKVENGSAGPVLWCKGPVRSVTFSPSEKWLASGSDDKIVRLWKVEDGSAGPVLQGHTRRVNSVTFSPSEKWLASGSNDNTVRLWKVEDGSAGPVLQGHRNNVSSVAFSPSEKWLASGGMDHTVRFWNIDKGQCIFCIRYENAISEMRLSKSGLLIAGVKGAFIFCTKLIEDDKGRIKDSSLLWSGHYSFFAGNANIKKARLSSEDKKLFLQKGAVDGGNPVSLPEKLKTKKEKEEGKYKEVSLGKRCFSFRKK